MATAKQIEANRRNAQKCTGPKTEEGQSPLRAERSEVIASESRDDYNALIAEYHNHFAPATPQERSPVDALIRYEWLSRRDMAADAAVWNHSLANSEVPHMGLTYLQHSLTLSRASRAFNNARRGYTTTLKELEVVQDRGKVEEREIRRPEPTQSKPLDQNLVSFRQIERAPTPEPRPLTRTVRQGAETPPLAA